MSACVKKNYQKGGGGNDLTFLGCLVSVAHHVRHAIALRSQDHQAQMHCVKQKIRYLLYSTVQYSTVQ